MRDSSFVDFIAFRKMITPWIVIYLFWIATAISWIEGCRQLIEWSDSSQQQGSMPNDPQAVVMRLIFSLFFIVIPVVTRLFCETVIVFFVMNSSLTDIRSYGREAIEILGQVDSSLRIINTDVKIAVMSEDGSEGWEDINLDEEDTKLDVKETE